MDNNLPIDHLLHEISSEEGQGFSYNRDQIVKDLTARQAVYAKWGISLLSIIGGVLAAVFFIGFILLAGLYDSPSGMLILGLLFIAGSVWINKVAKNLLLDTSTISFYVSGYAMLLAGFFFAPGVGQSEPACTNMPPFICSGYCCDGQCHAGVHIGSYW